MKGLKKPQRAKAQRGKGLNPLDKPLTDKQKLFAEIYVSNGFNRTKAIIATGTPEKSANKIGSDTARMPHVRAYIDKLMTEQSAILTETKKLVTDIQRANISDYMKPTKVVKTFKIEVGLQVLIDELNQHIRREEIFCERMGYTGEAFDKFQENLNHSRVKIIRYEIELEQNPNATRIVDSKPQLVDEMHIDIVALAKDKERGKIKKFKVSPEGGIELELYSSLDAAEKNIKMAGGYEKDNRQKAEAPKQVMKWGGMEIEF